MPSESITSTTAAAGCTGCTWAWSMGEIGVPDHWVFLVSDCVNAGCFCPDTPTTAGTYQGEQITLPCQAFPTTTTSSTSSTTTTSSSSSTTTSSTSSTSTSSTSSTTTSTTTTPAPCTGGCTWRWNAAGSTWLRYGPGNCSTGCSCQAPTTPGTVDGEYQTVSCGRLTCQACCGANCCLIPVSCCGSNFKIKPTLTVTVVAPVNWPCADGLSFTLHYWTTNAGDGLIFYRTQGPRNYGITLLDLDAYYGSIGAHHVTQCEDLKFGNPGNNCTWKPTDPTCYTDFDFGFVLVLNPYYCQGRILSYLATGYNDAPYCNQSGAAPLAITRMTIPQEGTICTSPLVMTYGPNGWAMGCSPGPPDQGLCQCIDRGGGFYVNLNATGVGTLKYVVTE